VEVPELPSPEGPVGTERGEKKFIDWSPRDVTIEPGGKKGKLVFNIGDKEPELALDIRVEEGRAKRLPISGSSRTS
jgi:hypothetical protein